MLPSFLEQVIPIQDTSFVVSLGDGQIKMIDCREPQRFSSSWTTDFSKKKIVGPAFECSLGQTNHAGSCEAQRAARRVPVPILGARVSRSHRHSKHALFLHHWEAISDLHLLLRSPVPDRRSSHLVAAFFL